VSVCIYLGVCVCMCREHVFAFVCVKTFFFWGCVSVFVCLRVCVCICRESVLVFVFVESAFFCMCDCVCMSSECVFVRIESLLSFVIKKDNKLSIRTKLEHTQKITNSQYVQTHTFVRIESLLTHTR